MLRFRLKHNDSLVRSELFDEQTFYNQFKKDIKKAKSSILIESPFMTAKRCADLHKLILKASKRGVRVRINTRRPSDHGRSLSYQSQMAINMFHDTKVQIFVCSDMRHRKLAIIDGEILYEGSLNILSQARSKEIMRRTVSKRLCKQMIQFAGLKRRFR